MILVGGENLMDMIQVDNQYQNALFKAIPGGSPYNLALAAGTGMRVFQGCWGRPGARPPWAIEFTNGFRRNPFANSIAAVLTNMVR